jgi:hypothetical protein
MFAMNTKAIFEYTKIFVGAKTGLNIENCVVSNIFGAAAGNCCREGGDAIGINTRSSIAMQLVNITVSQEELT